MTDYQWAVALGLALTIVAALELYGLLRSVWAKPGEARSTTWHDLRGRKLTVLVGVGGQAAIIGVPYNVVAGDYLLLDVPGDHPYRVMDTYVSTESGRPLIAIVLPTPRAIKPIPVVFAWQGDQPIGASA